MLEILSDSSELKVVESVPGWIHDITNVGDELLIVALWANEVFDHEFPDTYAELV
jgi:UDP-2-acetamido-2,6-beta-L-arabino-hexul-4-ose reductase